VGSAPAAVRLLGEDLVLWRDDAGAVHAVVDRCPHRGAALSLGRIVAGRLECPYHGWQFDGSGACRLIPARAAFEPGLQHAATAHATVEAHGLVWLRLERGDAPLPAFAFDTDRQVLCGPYDVATSAPRIVENFLDIAHFGFVHAGGLGSREHVETPPYGVKLTGTGVEVSGVRVWQPRSNVDAAGSSEVDYRYQVLAPYAAQLHKLPQAQQSLRDTVALMVCPRDAESSRVWFVAAMSGIQATDNEVRAFQDAIFAQDQPVLESQRPRRLPLAGEAHGPADRASIVYRRFLQSQGVTFGVC
jgi:phenylpropionate dioxygenase-like ring-hydroxylating dioxygenase large terminal subunit